MKHTISVLLFIGVLFVLGGTAHAQDVCYPPMDPFTYADPIPCPNPPGLNYSDPNGGWWPQCDNTGYAFYWYFTQLDGWVDPEWFASVFGCYPY